MNYQVKYSVSNTGLLKDKCEYTGYLIGGYYCVNCPHFRYKNRKLFFVNCTLNYPKQ